MVGRLNTTILAMMVLIALSCNLGCQPSSEREPQATLSDTQKAQEAGSEWTPEMKEAFKKAHDRSRKNEDK